MSDRDIGPGSGEETTVEIEVGIMDWFRQHSDDPRAAIAAALREQMERERRVSCTGDNEL